MIPRAVTETALTPPASEESWPAPAALVAVTATEYVVPLVNPLTEHVKGLLSDATDVEHVAPPGVSVAV